jgi:nucleoside-diphosphate-sugar epimerase
VINNFKKIIEEDLSYITDVDLPWRELEGKNILISGASGALPAYMVESILYLNDKFFRQKSTIFALVRNKEKAQNRFERYKDNKYLKFIIQDVCDKIALDEDIDYIIHAASNASPKYYGQDPVGTLLPNVLGTYNLLELARKKNVKCFLFFSSGSVYGNIENYVNLTAEGDFGMLNPLSINSCYPESKRMGETMCAAWLSQYHVPFKIIRPFHTYGPGISLSDGRVFADFCRNIVNNEDIIINSDGSAKRAFCYLADATIGFFMVLLKGKIGEAYNIAGGDEISILELARILVELFPEKKLKIIHKPNIDKAYLRTNVSDYAPDTAKIKNLGWTPKYSIEAGFMRTINSYFYEKIK